MDSLKTPLGRLRMVGWWEGISFLVLLGIAMPLKYWANLPQLARLALARVGVTQVAGGADCTVSDAQQFYSFRRDRITGRMASLIWIR